MREQQHGNSKEVSSKNGSPPLISISSGVIEQVRTLCDAGLASMGYFYFDFRDEDKTNHRNLLLSLLLQLSAQSEICCDILLRLHTSHKGGRKTSSDGALTKCLKRMLSFTSQLPIYLVMDALDECPNSLDLPSPRKQVLELVKDPRLIYTSQIYMSPVDPRTTYERYFPGRLQRGTTRS
jgi:hypothetical protein